MTPDSANASEDQGRRLLQSVGLLVCCCLSVMVAICFGTRGFAGSEARTVCLPEKINPNTAPVGSLIRLPGIGLTRARAIAAHRDAVRQQTDEVAFDCPEDLERIKGIGPKTAQDLAEWLEFDSSVLDNAAHSLGSQASP